MAISTLNIPLKMVIRDKVSTKASWNTALRKGKFVLSSEKAKCNIFLSWMTCSSGSDKKTGAIHSFIEENPKFFEFSWWVKIFLNCCIICISSYLCFRQTRPFWNVWNALIGVLSLWLQMDTLEAVLELCGFLGSLVPVLVSASGEHWRTERVRLLLQLLCVCELCLSLNGDCRPVVNLMQQLLPSCQQVGHLNYCHLFLFISILKYQDTEYYAL